MLCDSFTAVAFNFDFEIFIAMDYPAPYESL